MKDYQLVIKVKELRVDYADECEAHNKQEAAKLFFERLPAHLKDWTPFILESWIIKQDEMI